MSLVGLVSAACSATTYSSQVDQFANATSTTQTAFATLEDQARASQLQLNIYTATATGAAVIVDPNCGSEAPNSTCTVTMMEPGGQPEPLLPHLTTPNALQLMQSVSDYANGLQKLTKSDDIASLNNNITNLNTAVNNLAKAASAASGGQDITGAIGPIETIVEWAGMNYLETRRAQAFREAVIGANTPVGEVADILAQEANELKRLILRADSATLHTKSVALARARKANPDDLATQRDAIRSLMQDGATIDQFASVDPAEPFERMKVAHAALVAAVQKPGISIAEVSEKAQAFYNAARNLYNAVQATRKD